jgi:hypothetical protein
LKRRAAATADGRLLSFLFFREGRSLASGQRALPGFAPSVFLLPFFYRQSCNQS